MENLPLINRDPVFLDNNSSKLNFFQKKFVFYVVGLIVFLFFAYFLFFSAPVNFPTGIVININEGMSLRAISKDLEMDQIIRSRVIFETIIIFLGNEKRLVPGDYLFEKKISVFEIARRISRGEKHLAPIKVTIPEGFNIFDIAKVSALKLTNFNTERFLLEAKNEEGYLFPDTYFFLTADGDAEVLHAMRDNYEKKILPLRSQIISSGKTEKQIITMASLIEKESKGDADRKFISGILWKRLSINMPLQVDAEKSTYKTKGLPKNPICNPGIKSIEAAIYPEVSNYLYYLHDSEGNIHYATTFAEHKLNKQKYLK